MIALCFLACLALASAAPQYGHLGHHERRPFRAPPPPPRDGSSEEFFGGEIFDARRFWAEMATEMQRFDQMLSEFNKHFPTTSSEAGVKGNEYVVTISLNGYEEKDIKVKAREGVLMVQAVHTAGGGSIQSHTELKTLPSYVNVNGTWTFNMGILKIVFPLKSRPEDVTETAVTEVETQTPNTENRDREEVEETQNENVNHDADVGLERGDKDAEILTNEIPNVNNAVEATTYAVDLKNEVEFVPVNY